MEFFVRTNKKSHTKTCRNVRQNVTEEIKEQQRQHSTNRNQSKAAQLLYNATITGTLSSIPHNCDALGPHPSIPFIKKHALRRDNYGC